MTVLLLRKIAFVIIFCNIVTAHQDFLEYYKPRPGLPKPLNEWLTYVQEHKTDFKLINNIVKRRKEEQEYYDETEETNHNQLFENDEDEYVDEVPQNDIYPHQSQKIEKNAYQNSDTTFRKQRNNKKQRKKHNKSNRMRRESSKNSFFEQSNKLEVELNGKLGEIKRLGEKYLDQFRNKDQQGKREIQIDVLNDGKLVKSIKEPNKDSKSVLLNIDTLQDPHNQIVQNKIPVKKSNTKVLHTPVQVYHPQNNFRSDNTQLDIEKAVNYNNLFTVNKDLNTDRSVPKNILMYHVTLENTDLPILETTTFGNYSAYNFHQNNFRDMSKYWSDAEKHQLQKGIQFAHDTIDLKSMVQTIPKFNSKLTDGYESVKSIVVDHSLDKEFPKRMQFQYQPHIKRNLETLQGAVQVQNKDYGEVLESSVTPLELPTENEAKEEISTETEVQIILNKHHNPPNENVKEIEKEEKEEAEDNVIDIKYTTEKINPELFHHHENQLPDAADVHHGNEHINNHIDITIIQPQEEDIDAKVKEGEIPNLQKDEYHQRTHKGNNREEEIYKEIELEKQTPLEENNNKEQETYKEKEVKEEIGVGDTNEEGENVRQDEVEEEIVKEEQIKDKNGHKYKDLEDKTDEKINNEEIVNHECSAEEKKHSSIPEEENIEHILKKQKKVNKGPRIRLQVDISKDAQNEDVAKKRASSSNSKRSRSQNKKLVYCNGKNCDTHSSEMELKRHTKNELHNRIEQVKNKHSNNKKKIESHKFRKLKSVNYIYDTDIEAPKDEDYAEDETSSERSQLSDINKKEAVEGDYGDEEDSFTIKKNETKKLVKLTKNDFANPRGISSHEDDDDDEYYDEEAPTTKNKNNSKDVTYEHIAKYRSREHTPEFGKHMHKKPKPIPKVKKGNTRHKDAVKNEEDYVREPRSQASLEDFQQLPKFVMNDRINEKNLRKRSLTSNKEFTPNKFPLSSKGFFTRDSKQNEFKRSERIDRDNVPVSVPSVTDNVNTNDAVTALFDGNTVVSNNSNNGSTLVDFHDLPGVGETTTIATPSASTQCDESRVNIGNVCQTEKFNKSDIEITTLLSIIPDVQLQMINNDSDLLKPKEKFEKLDETLSGELPISLVDTIYDHLKNDQAFKTRLFRGMKRRHEKLPITSDDIQVVTQEENKKMLNIMETIINKLEWNSNCKKIPIRFKNYLVSITKAETRDALTKTKEMEEVDFDDTQNTRHFLFNQEGQGTPSIALTQKAKILKDMLDKFEQLPPDCKVRAEPVKKYVEEHLIMLEHVNDLMKSQHHNTETVTEVKEVSVQSHQKPIRRNEQTPEDELIEEQLESLGLGKNHDFKPKFDLDEMVEKSKNNVKQQREGKALKSKKKSKRELTKEGSKQYQKLLEAVKRERIKREGRRRLAESFGKLNVDDYMGENPSNVIKDIFEPPVVYTL